MRSFRPIPSDATRGPALDFLAIGQLIDDAMRLGNFYVGPELRVALVAGRAETIPWELFQGRLLDAKQTREARTFLSWNLFEENDTHPATEPLISVKLDVQAGQIHVTRGLLCYVWEGHDAGGVIESREVIRWTRELVGTITLIDFHDAANLRDELICLIWQAVVGTSRLPLTSLEAPLAVFVLGQLHYLYRSDAPERPMTQWEDMLPVGTESAVASQETVKLVEFILRLTTWDSLRFLGMLAATNSQFVQSWQGWTRLWRELFNSVSLSPQTRLVRNALICMAIGLPIEERTDVDCHLLRQLGRHLAAYDLVTFHHGGANYPDALLLDELLKRFVETASSFPELFQGDVPNALVRRCALRQACLMRRHYEGLLVPDLPTSPGENARVMPASHPRVPEEQLLQPHRRRRKLFADDSLAGLLTERAREVLAQSVADLRQPDERTELGMGVFIDRPLGYAKAPAEPDQTPLLAHEAFSPSIARRRWQELKKLCVELGIDCEAATLDPLFENGPWPAGLPHTQVAECPRPTAALGDVRKVAADFVILRTKPVGLANMLSHFKTVERLRSTYQLHFLNDEKSPRVCVPAFDERKQPVLACFDEQIRRRIEMRVDTSQGYVTRAGVELPKAGLRVVAVWEDTDDPTVLARREVAE